MIELAGSAQRGFRFPAPPAQAFDFYRDVAGSMRLLRHISIEARLGPDRYRLLYSATEAALYRVRVFCEVRASSDESRRRIAVDPLRAAAGVRAGAEAGAEVGTEAEADAGVAGTGAGAAGGIEARGAIAAGLNSMTGSGRYSSRIRFEPDDAATLVTCSLSLHASLPVALSLRWLPASRASAAANRILRRRIDEILGCFVERSIAAFLRGQR